MVYCAESKPRLSADAPLNGPFYAGKIRNVVSAVSLFGMSSHLEGL